VTAPPAEEEQKSLQYNDALLHAHPIIHIFFCGVSAQVEAFQSLLPKYDVENGPAPHPQAAN
jgi:hypothetical protein